MYELYNLPGKLCKVYFQKVNQLYVLPAWLPKQPADPRKTYSVKLK